jgi:FkbM family methyltransferase
MNTYFILTKTKHSNVDDRRDEQILDLGAKNVFILPSVNIKYYMDNGLFEKNLIEWCKEFCTKSGVFLDIGGHTGTYALNLAAHVDSVHVFEPQRATYYALCGGIALSGLSAKILAHNCGLGSPDQVGTQTLNIVSVDGGGSSIQNIGGVLDTEQIDVRTLDEFGINNVCFIKMDVEGNELDVLKGAHKTIERSGYPRIMFEYNSEHSELLAYLTTELGYSVVPIRGYANMYLACRDG